MNELLEATGIQKIIGRDMMEEVNNSPFDRAKKNIKNLANKIDMMQTLIELEIVLDSSKDLPDHEKEGVKLICSGPT